MIAKDFEEDVIKYGKFHEEVDEVVTELGGDDVETRAARLVLHLAVDIADSLDSIAAAIEDKH